MPIIAKTGGGGNTEWVKFMQDAVKAGRPVSLSDLRQRGYTGSSRGVETVTSGQHVNKPFFANQKNDTGGLSGSIGGFQLPQTNAMKIGGTVALDRLYGKSEPGGIHQILGTSNPSAGVSTNLFTVLGKHTARMSVLWVANRRLISAKVRVGFDVAGGNTNIVPDDAWLYYNVEIPAESTLVLDAATGFWLGARDDVVVYTDISGISFGASGVEYSTF